MSLARVPASLHRRECGGAGVSGGAGLGAAGGCAGTVRGMASPPNSPAYSAIPRPYPTLSPTRCAQTPCPCPLETVRVCTERSRAGRGRGCPEEPEGVAPVRGRDSWEGFLGGVVFVRGVPLVRAWTAGRSSAVVARPPTRPPVRGEVGGLAVWPGPRRTREGGYPYVLGVGGFVGGTPCFCLVGLGA